MARVYVRQGASGGPVFDAKAELVGITHAGNFGDGVGTFFSPTRLIQYLRGYGDPSSEDSSPQIGGCEELSLESSLKKWRLQSRPWKVLINMNN